MSKKARGFILAIGAVVVVVALVLAVMWLKTNTSGDGRDGESQSASAQSSGSSSAGSGAGAAAVPMKPLLKSPVDANHNGVDDYTDFVRGARQVAKRHPQYDNGYYQGGYPPAGRGACTDLIVDAFEAAGYNLKAMVDSDIASHRAQYPSISKPDPNIDYRRTGTLSRFFALHAQKLTTDVHQTQQWQQGDIVVFENTRHIGMVGDTRDSAGIAYLIHNNHQRGSFEEDFLAHTKLTITGHYRFDASRIDSSIIRFH